MDISDSIIKKSLNEVCVEIYDEIDSTNDYLKRCLFSKKYKKDALCIAKSQTNGHGSNDRKFISNKNVGIYFSILHFYNDMEEIKFLTQKLSVAVYNAFLNRYNITLSMKWVNDLYYNGKKVCGILCKNYIEKSACIMGIGIDLYEDKNISEEIKNIAGYIFEKKIEDVEYLIIDIVKQIYNLLSYDGIPKIYIKKNMVLNKKVELSIDQYNQAEEITHKADVNCSTEKNTIKKIGKIINIDNDGNLIVDFNDSVRVVSDTNINIIK